MEGSSCPKRRSYHRSEVPTREQSKESLLARHELLYLASSSPLCTKTILHGRPASRSFQPSFATASTHDRTCVSSNDSRKKPSLARRLFFCFLHDGLMLDVFLLLGDDAVGDENLLELLALDGLYLD